MKAAAAVYLVYSAGSSWHSIGTAGCYFLDFSCKFMKIVLKYISQLCGLAVSLESPGKKPGAEGVREAGFPISQAKGQGSLQLNVYSS